MALVDKRTALEFPRNEVACDAAVPNKEIGFCADRILGLRQLSLDICSSLQTVCVFDYPSQVPSIG